MRVGLATSLLAHAVLITLGVIGLHQAVEVEPLAVEAISVELVPIEEVASIRLGSEQSRIIETPAPAAVDTPEPATPAERPGNTEKDQPAPQETPKESPAPTVQTAPEPTPTPEPDPTPKPEETPPTPLPTPPAEEQKVAEVQPDPELAAEPTADTPTNSPTPVPTMRTAAIEVQRAEHNPTPPKQAETTKAQTPKETKPADQVAELINTEASRGTTTGSGGQAAAGKTTGQAARLTQSELGALIAQMRKCWNPTLNERNEGVIIRLLVAMNTDGSVAGTPQILTDTTTSPLLGLSARTAARKVEQCGPFSLPADKFDHWREIDVTLDASQAN